MTSVELRKARLDASWTQARLAGRLGVTQAYLSLMEAGKRRVPDRVTRMVTSLFQLPPTFLPRSRLVELDLPVTEEELEQDLARLGYPGFAYRKKPGQRRNPGELLLMALRLEDLDPRLTEALPWLLVSFEGLNFKDLVEQAKTRDLQNRLGFTVSLAEQVVERSPAFRHRAGEFNQAKQALERSRLAREDTYGRRETSERMRAWLRENRSPEAEHWNLLTDLKVEHLPYADTNPGTLAGFPK